MDIKFYAPYKESIKLNEKNITEGYVDNLNISFWNSSLVWNFQTYLRLQEQGYPCQLVDSFPEEGVVVVHRGDLPFNRKPTADLLFVTTLGDAGWHPYSQVQVVQNPNHVDVSNTFHMNHWTQPGLIPRRDGRGEAFENVGYFGHPDQLADELHTEKWKQFLAGHDLNWISVSGESERRRDYSDIDLIVAIRSFDGRSYDHKPATKLHNAWLAGVPAILGPESAYQAERRDDLDYLEARSYDELRECVTSLKHDSTLRQKLRKRSEANGARIDPKEKAKQWWELLTGPVWEIYRKWRACSALGRKSFIAKRWTKVKRNSLRKRLDEWGAFTK